MKIELNESEVKHAVINYLKEVCSVEAAAKDVKLDGYSNTRTATWETKEDTNGE